MLVKGAPSVKSIALTGAPYSITELMHNLIKSLLSQKASPDLIAVWLSLDNDHMENE